jgi:glycosyltransferase involved in cell wall biosynthesis
VRFSVVIPTFGRLALLEETLESLYACEPPPDEILVVDGDPKLSTEEVARRSACSA